MFHPDDLTTQKPFCGKLPQKKLPEIRRLGNKRNRSLYKMINLKVFYKYNEMSELKGKRGLLLWKLRREDNGKLTFEVVD
jgi:hypothetical protein